MTTGPEPQFDPRVRLAATGAAFSTSMAAPTLIVVAHPGEETLGCCRLLLHQPDTISVLHVADGVSHDERALQRSGAEDPQEFLRIRQNELHAAMEILGVAQSRLHSVGIPELEAPLQLQSAVEAILHLLRAERPQEVHTHPFEGGHPDTDAVCFAVHYAVRILEELGEVRPAILEFTGYHARDGLFRSAEFLTAYPSAQIAILEEDQLARKEKAMRCFRSQYDLYVRFNLKEERWRRSPGYDFSTRPHEGPLYYEVAGSGFTWDNFESFLASMRRTEPLSNRESG